MARRIRITSKSHTITTKQPLISYSRIDKGKSKFIQTRHKMNAIDTRSKTPRAQGGKGLLSHTISVQESQKSISKILILEKKRKNKEEERGAT